MVKVLLIASSLTLFMASCAKPAADTSPAPGSAKGGERTEANTITTDPEPPTTAVVKPPPKKPTSDAMDGEDLEMDGKSTKIELKDFGTIGKRLTRVQVQKVMRATLTPIKKCGRQSNVSGTILVKVALKGDGTITSAKVRNHDNSPLEKCVAAVIKRLSFPAFSGGEVQFSYPIRIPAPSKKIRRFSPPVRDAPGTTHKHDTDSTEDL